MVDEVKKAEAENRENRFYFRLGQLGDLPRLFADTTKGTPFEGARLRFTGKRLGGYYEFELIAPVSVYQTIPGYQLVGYAKAEDGKTFHVHRLADFEWSKELVDALDPLRCDVCNQRRVRKRQFVVRKIDTGELLYVGGSCARKFCDIDLEVLIHKFFRQAEEIFREIGSRWDAIAVFKNKCFEVALAEELVRRRGYVSQKKAEISNDYPTASYVGDWYQTYKGQPTEAALAVRKLIGEAIVTVNKRAKEFEETEFQELIDHFEGKLREKWTEFDNNCVAWLRGKSFSWGLAAYFGSIKPTLDGDAVDRNKKRVEAVKGFDAVATGKCLDLGKFTVVNTKWRSNHFGDSLAFTVVSEDGGKLWFQVTENCKSAKDWQSVVNDRMIRQSDGIEVELRGTVTEIKRDVSFAKRVQIKKIFDNGKELN